MAVDADARPNREDSSSEASRGVILSGNGTILRLGQAVGPLLLGLALVVGTIETVFYAAGGVALLVGAGAVGLLSAESLFGSILQVLRCHRNQRLR